MCIRDRDLYSAEEQLIAALPKMVEAASSTKIKGAFRDHLELTRKHHQRLEQIFSKHGESPRGKKCKGMEGLIKEGEDIIKEDAPAEVKDVALIAAAQRVEHYEIAAYGTVRTFASKLGLHDDKAVLQETLNEEGATDILLTQLAQGSTGSDGANAQAMPEQASMSEGYGRQSGGRNGDTRREKSTTTAAGKSRQS